MGRLQFYRNSQKRNTAPAVPLKRNLSAFRILSTSHPLMPDPASDGGRPVAQKELDGSTINQWTDRTDTKQFRKNFLPVAAVVAALLELALRKCGSGQEPCRAGAASLIWVAGLAFL